MEAGGAGWAGGGARARRMPAAKIARSAGLVQCLVSDDGHASVGAPPGTGTLLVNSLADELGGFVVRRASHDGTCVVLSFPELGGAGVRDVAARKD